MPRARYAAADDDDDACCGKAGAILFQFVRNELFPKEEMDYMRRVGRGVLIIIHAWY